MAYSDSTFDLSFNLRLIYSIKEYPSSAKFLIGSLICITFPSFDSCASKFRFGALCKEGCAVSSLALPGTGATKIVSPSSFLVPLLTYLEIFTIL